MKKINKVNINTSKQLTSRDNRGKAIHKYTENEATQPRIIGNGGYFEDQVVVEREMDGFRVFDRETCSGEWVFQREKGEMKNGWVFKRDKEKMKNGWVFKREDLRLVVFQKEKQKGKMNLILCYRERNGKGR